MLEQGFPNTMSSWGGTVPPQWHVPLMRGGAGRGRQKICGGGGDFGLKKSNICKIRFCMFNTYFCVLLFCDSAVVNIGC